MKNWIPQKDVRKYLFGFLMYFDGFVIDHTKEFTNHTKRLEKTREWERERSNKLCAWGNDWGSMTRAMIYRGYLKLLQWWETYTNIKMVQFKDICAFSARYGRLDILQWLRAGGAPWDTWTCNFAARNGHLKVLQWARAQNPPAPWNSATLENARNQPIILEWLREKGALVPP